MRTPRTKTSNSSSTKHQLVRFLLAACFVLSCQATKIKGAQIAPDSDPSVTFLLLDNGSSADGLPVTLAKSEFPLDKSDNDKNAVPPKEAFALSMSSRISVSKHQAPQPVLATRAYRQDGELIEEWEQLLPETKGGDLQRIYLVADDLEFVWPFVEFGHRQVVSTKVVPPVGGEPVILESFSDKPRVFRVLNMATQEECDQVTDRALNATGKDALKRSTVGSGTDAEGNDVASEDFGRTSENTWDYTSPAAKAMITRSFQLTNIEENDGKRDGLQVVRYKPGQGYNTHPDYFTPDKGKYADELNDFDFHPYSGGSNRFATVFMYLNNPEEGGSTLFPMASSQDPKHNQLEPDLPSNAVDMFQQGTWEYNVNQDCYNPKKLSVPPVSGTAALFYSITPDGQIDPLSHHAACPLINGTKWGANIWIWNKQRFGDIRTGEPRTLQITNLADDTVYISWEGRPNGVLAPRQTTTFNSFEFHRFKAGFESHKGKSFASFTVQGGQPAEVPQQWEIEAPRNYQRRAEVQAQEETEEDQSVTVDARNGLDEPVDLLWQGEPLGITVEAGNSVVLNTFFGHTLQAATKNRVPSTYHVKADGPKKQFWSIGTERSGEATHDEL